MQEITKYQLRDIIPTNNGIIIKSTHQNFATTIRNHYSFEIFGPHALLTRLNHKPLKQLPQPCRPPTLSVVIRGVEVTITDKEIKPKLTQEGLFTQIGIRIKAKTGQATYKSIDIWPRNYR